MTDTNEKIRSLFLTALMVFSVFAMSTAFAGAAAADEPTVDQAVHYGAGNAAASVLTDVSEGDPVLEVQFDQDVQVTGSPATVTIGKTDGSEQDVDFGTEGQDYYLNGDQLVIATDTEVQRIENVSFSGVSDTSDPAVAIDSEEDFDAIYAPTTVDLADGDSSNEEFRGANVVIQGQPDTEFDIVSEPSEDHSVSRTRGTGGDFVYVLGTGNLELGDYNIQTSGDANYGDTNATLSVEDLGFSATAVESTFDEDEDVEVTVEASSIGRDVDAELIDANGNVDADTTATIDSDGEATISFSDVDPDNYTVEVTDVGTGITSTTDEFEVVSVGDAEASFGESVVSEERGDIARIPIELENTDEATATIGNRNDDGYQMTLDVEDGNGDGEVVVTFNTFLAASGSPSSVIDTVNDDDDVEIAGDGETATFNGPPAGNDILDASSYSMNVTAGAGSSALSNGVVDDSQDVATLDLQERSTENAQVWTAPDDTFSDISDAADDDDVAAVYELAANDNLTQSDTVAFDDTLVVQVEASGLEGAFESEGGDAEAYKSVSGTEDGIFQLTLEEANPGANSAGDDFNINDITTEDVAVIYDEANDTHFVAIDTDSVNSADGDLSAVKDGDEYVANFTVSEESDLSEDTVAVNDTFTFEEPDSTLNGDQDITVQAASGQEIPGTTNVAPGTEVTVKISSQSDASPFLKQPTAYVQADGSFTAVADFSENSPGTNFTASTAISDDEIDGTIGAAPSASVSISDQESNGETVVVDSATLSQGGFIAIHNGSATGDVIGASSYLEAGSHEDVEVTLDTTQSEDFTAVAMPHLDTDGDQTYDFPDNDGPYTANGSAVTDSAAVTIVSGEETTTEQTTTEQTTTEQPTTEETTEEATTMETTTEETTTGDSGPGFTAVLALVALVAAALLAVRRDN
ncbi:surface glycoprotein [Halomicroarcula sp. F13]|uniref:Surface glycoprotein n=1 Tax=Haloarcula rubra TaxID=2487747 RepID=A0AAW4PUU6_9EURY|nr:BGTF surface domain-containing protein [Halomicroarcula rubra]MBX0324037.1 surface glycoprotein [Halomicroarcula rubra]